MATKKQNCAQISFKKMHQFTEVFLLFPPNQFCPNRLTALHGAEPLSPPRFTAPTPEDLAGERVKHPEMGPLKEW